MLQTSPVYLVHPVDQAVLLWIILVQSSAAVETNSSLYLPVLYIAMEYGSVLY